MTSFYTDPAVREISERLDIVDIVAETVNLTRKGNRYWGLCPFHQEKTPSFSVSAERNMFYCFGCHAGGDLFTYVMKRDGLEFKEALELLAARAGVELSHGGSAKGNDRRKRIIEINQAAAEYYHRFLMEQPGREAMAYLLKRGIEPETIEHFQLGLAPDDWNRLEEYLLKKGISQEYLKLSGLIKRNEKRNSYYDLFRKRIIFPIRHYGGEIIGFGGRVMDQELPKYLNTPETEVYAKRHNLYGLYQAREAIRRLNEVILVEGYMDCIKLHQAGITNCVATLGTALTHEQASLMHRYAEQVIIVYDGDEAGQRETMRAAGILTEEGLKVKVLVLPSGKDPDDLIEIVGKEEFGRYIQNNKINSIEFKIKRCLNEDKNPDLEAKIRIISLVRDDIIRLGSEVEKDHYIKTLARYLKLEEMLVRREIQAGNTRKATGPRNKTLINRDNIQYGNYSNYRNYSIDEKILAAMLTDLEVFSRVQSAIGLKFFPRKEQQELAAAFAGMEGDASDRLHLLGQELEGEELQSTLARTIALADAGKKLDMVEIEAFINRVRRMKAKARWQRIYQELEQLREKGDFDHLLKFILKLDTFLENTREGGTA